ncbi:MAG: hypothetical protein HYT67_01620 [Candidatus Yanofskybacteria bacterium]|nr:hypothetical protein [Candidatus Yanofskybacteria bacterium]
MKTIRVLFSLIFVVLAGCNDSINRLNPASPTSIYPIGEGSVVGNLSEAVRDLSAQSGIPDRINGVEFLGLRGWFANMYPWEYLPEQSTVHPVPRLWTPGRTPSPFQMMEQCRQIKEFGGGAAVLLYNGNSGLDSSDHNYWLSNGFANGCGPFFLLYEHINGTRFIPADGGPKDMNNPYNRQVFKDDIDFMFKNVIVPNQSRYVTVSGRAVIYMWSSVQMTGDFASLLEEVKKDYPVFFIGSGEAWSRPNGADNIARVKALDGFMEYTLGGHNNYLNAVSGYRRASFGWRDFLRELESETGKRYLFISTFQAAYDDTKVIPKRSNPPMYARNINEVKYHAELIAEGMRNDIYNSAGPFVVYSELPEGAAVIESQCRPDTLDKSGWFVGCGAARLKILKDYFGR